MKLKKFDIVKYNMKNGLYYKTFKGEEILIKTDDRYEKSTDLYNYDEIMNPKKIEKYNNPPEALCEERGELLIKIASDFEEKLKEKDKKINDFEEKLKEKDKKINDFEMKLDKKPNKIEANKLNLQKKIDILIGIRDSLQEKNEELEEKNKELKEKNKILENIAKNFNELENSIEKNNDEVYEKIEQILGETQKININLSKPEIKKDIPKVEVTDIEALGENMKKGIDYFLQAIEKQNQEKINKEEKVEKEETEN